MCLSFLVPRARRAHRLALEQILPALLPVQDDLGNVPVAMQEDAHANGLLSGCVDTACAEVGVRTAKRPHVLSAVFEEIYRREAIAVLSLCDRLEEEKDPTYLQARNSGEGGAEALRTYVEAHYERPRTLVL